MCYAKHANMLHPATPGLRNTHRFYVTKKIAMAAKICNKNSTKKPRTNKEEFKLKHSERQKLDVFIEKEAVVQNVIRISIPIVSNLNNHIIEAKIPPTSKLNLNCLFVKVYIHDR